MALLGTDAACIFRYHCCDVESNRARCYLVDVLITDTLFFLMAAAYNKVANGSKERKKSKTEGTA